MAVDYTIDYGCPVKRAVGGIEAFLQLGKVAGQASALEELKATQPDFTDDTPVRHFVSTPEGKQESEPCTLRELRRQAQTLYNQEPTCRDCPANVLGQAGGCSGCVHYPVPASTEQWIMDQLPKRIKGDTRWELFKAAVKDFGCNAEYVDRLRRCDGFYELRKPYVDVWGCGPFGKTTCTSSVILGNLFHVNHIEPVHGQIMCYLLGLTDALYTDGRGRWQLDMTNFPPSTTTNHVVWMLRALHEACVLDVKLLVHP